MNIWFFLILLLPVAGALALRFCLEQAIRRARDTTPDWGQALIWAGSGLMTLFFLILVSLLGMWFLKAGVIGAGLALVATVFGLVSPELWTATAAWLRDPRHLPWLVVPFVLVGLVIFFLTNGSLAITLISELLVLLVIGLGIGLMFRPFRRRK
ncbi:MAG: hypothetical protein Q8N65_02100 [bacterium]|nr:hypothetical protein [bacterium]